MLVACLEFVADHIALMERARAGMECLDMSHRVGRECTVWRNSLHGNIDARDVTVHSEQEITKSRIEEALNMGGQ